MVKKHRSKDITILTNIFSFPNTVNEYAARFVAAFVVILSITYLLTQNLYILIFFALLESFFGFCTGCWVFKKMMNFGLIPQKICNKCESIGLID